MVDYISREAAIDAIEGINWYKYNDEGRLVQGGTSHDKMFLPYKAVEGSLKAIPAADVRPVVKAKWEDVYIDRPEIADLEVASMFCPNCNRWHNRVFHYGNPIEFENFCSFCGADMREES